MKITYDQFTDTSGIIAQFNLRKHNRRTISTKIIIGHDGPCGFKFFGKRENFDGRDLISIEVIVENISENVQLQIINEIEQRKIKRLRKIRKLILMRAQS